MAPTRSVAACRAARLPGAHRYCQSVAVASRRLPISHAAQHRSGKITVATGAEGPPDEVRRDTGRPAEQSSARQAIWDCPWPTWAAIGSTGSARSSRKRSGHTSQPEPANLCLTPCQLQDTTSRSDSGTCLDRGREPEDLGFSGAKQGGFARESAAVALVGALAHERLRGLPCLPG